MKRIFLASAVAVLAMLPVCASAAGLGDIKTVYLLPMSNGLDQYLASQLTIGSVLTVVTDPKQADVIFTDHLGESLEQTLTDLYGGAAKSEDAAAGKADDKGDGSQSFSKSGMRGQNGRGNVFLVDRKTRAVVWSNYEPPQYPSPDTMKRIAARISGKLARALKAK